MRRVAPIAAFGLFVLLTMPAWAQHGGGHGGGGHFGGGGFGGGHAGFSGGHFAGGGFRGSHASPGVSRSFSPSARFGTRPGFGRGPYLHNGFRGSRFHTYGFRNNCYGYPCRGFYGAGYGYPWGYGGYYDPYWGWDDNSSYDNDYEQDLATAAQMNADSLAEQQMMRQEEADGDRDAYARPQTRSFAAPGSGGNGAAREEKQGSPIMPATVLVFRDEHKQEVQNYAIVGQTLWNFAPQHTQKIPLAELDLAATIKANDDNGVTFRVPNVNDGQ